MKNIIVQNEEITFNLCTKKYTDLTNLYSTLFFDNSCEHYFRNKKDEVEHFKKKLEQSITAKLNNEPWTRARENNVKGYISALWSNIDTKGNLMLFIDKLEIFLTKNKEKLENFIIGDKTSYCDLYFYVNKKNSNSCLVEINNEITKFFYH